jgi:hypothetical protein
MEFQWSGKANGIYLLLFRNILNFCSNLLVHTLSDIIFVNLIFLIIKRIT